MRYLEDIQIGMRRELGSFTFTAESIKAFDTIRERLMARGAADAFVTDFGAILSVFFRDPDGLPLEIYQS